MIRVPLPTGNVEVPSWCKNAYIDWDMNYSTPPILLLRVDGDIHSWPDQDWEYNDGSWFTTHPDGRMLQYVHNNKLVLGADGVYSTSNNGGHSGASVLIRSQGRTIRLNGPWSGGPPKNYVECRIVRGKKWPNDPWHEGFRYVGPYLSSDLFLRIVARFLPHLDVWDEVNIYEPLQVALPEWNMPKREWMRRT